MPRVLHLTLLAAVITAAAAECPSPEWQEFRNMCYLGMSDYILHWDEVADACNTVYPGAEMVVIHDAELNTFIAENIVVYPNGNRSGAWIGLSRFNSTSSWTWSDGSPVDYTQWYLDNPEYIGGNCVIINYAQWGKWVGHDCGLVRDYFTCQVPAL